MVYHTIIYLYIPYYIYILILSMGDTGNACKTPCKSCTVYSVQTICTDMYMTNNTVYDLLSYTL